MNFSIWYLEIHPRSFHARATSSAILFVCSDTWARASNRTASDFFAHTFKMSEFLTPVEEMTTEFTNYAATQQHPEFGKMFDAVEISSGIIILKYISCYNFKSNSLYETGGVSLLSSSNFCSRYWSGNLAFFSSPNLLGSPTDCYSFINLDSGVPCAKFISDLKVWI